MNIIELAKQAGLGFLIEPQWMCQDELEAFAKLVAAHEREECAKVVETLKLPDWPNKIRLPLAKAIRARSNT
jgi:hypothetical protein